MKIITDAVKNAAFINRFVAAIDAADKYRGLKVKRADLAKAKDALKTSLLASAGVSMPEQLPERVAGQATAKGLAALSAAKNPLIVAIAAINTSAEMPVYWAIDAVRAAMAAEAYRLTKSTDTVAERIAVKSDILAALGKAMAGSEHFQPPTDEPYSAGTEASIYTDVRNIREAFEQDAQVLAAVQLLLEPRNTQTALLARLWVGPLAAKICDTWEDIESVFGDRQRIGDDKGLNLRETWDEVLEEEGDEYQD